METVKFKKWICNVEVSKYRSNDRIAIELVEASTGEPVARATVNIPEVDLEPNEVIIKNYSENEGMYQALFEAGIISKAKIHVQTGNLTCAVCDYLNYEKDADAKV